MMLERHETVLPSPGNLPFAYIVDSGEAFDVYDIDFKSALLHSIAPVSTTLAVMGVRLLNLVSSDRVTQPNLIHLTLGRLVKVFRSTFSPQYSITITRHRNETANDN